VIAPALDPPRRIEVRTDAELASVLRMAVARLNRRLRTERPADALPAGLVAVLATLDRLGPLTPGRLAAAENVRPPSMTRTVAQLEESGFVRRDPHPTDGRQVLLQLTEAGRTVLLADRRRRQAWFSDHLQALDPAAREVLRAAAPILVAISEA
jgi:DNA-binding MarR family transcriptional regulator